MPNIALDLDGTITSHGWTTEDRPTINIKLIEQLVTAGIKKIDIITNQGGIVFGFRTLESFIEVIDEVVESFETRGIVVDEIMVALYHPKAKIEDVNHTTVRLNEMRSDIIAFAIADARKPSGFMLRVCKTHIYFGDSDEDEQAAKANGSEFVRVERFCKS